MSIIVDVLGQKVDVIVVDVFELDLMVRIYLTFRVLGVKYLDPIECITNTNHIVIVQSTLC